MNTEEITIRVDAKTAAAYRAADEQGRRKAAMMFALGFDRVTRDRRSVKEVFDQVSADARARGMDEAVFAELLRELDAHL